ncbi:hypothetical protein LCGC14_2700700, partial [marine sediment metagenome]
NIMVKVIANTIIMNILVAKKDEKDI